MLLDCLEWSPRWLVSSCLKGQRGLQEGSSLRLSGGRCVEAPRWLGRPRFGVRARRLGGSTCSGRTPGRQRRRSTWRPLCPRGAETHQQPDLDRRSRAGCGSRQERVPGRLAGLAQGCHPGYRHIGQILSDTGTRIGRSIRVSALGARADDTWPAVGYDPASQRFLVVWVDACRFASRGYDIYGRWVSATGALLGSDFRISAPSAYDNEGSPALAFNSTTGEFLVVWWDGRRAGCAWVGHLRSAGIGSGRPGGIELPHQRARATGSETVPAVAYSPVTGRYLVVWQDWRSRATRGCDIYGRLVSDSGTPSGSGIRISGRELRGTRPTRPSPTRRTPGTSW